MRKIVIIILLVFMTILTNIPAQSEDKPKILFDTFHCTHSECECGLLPELEQAGYRIELTDEEADILSLSKDVYDVLIVYVPTRGYLENEKEAIKTFVSNGGGLIIFGEHGRSEIHHSNSISRLFGIQFLRNSVEDRRSNYDGLKLWPIITNFRSHPITQSIQSIAYIFGCSLEIEPPAIALAFGNPSTYTEPPGIDPNKGEDIIIMAAIKYGKGKVVAIGDSNLTNSSYGRGDFLGAEDNRKLCFNMIEWVSEPIDTCSEDTDRDGVNDCDDECPRETGSSDNEGCPVIDKDNDGVPDDRDVCYNPDCASIDTQGCPLDSDGDGLNDCEDLCPLEFSEKENNGCPEGDSDSDGVPDDEDACFNLECTIIDAQGCPLDSDGDGLNDCEDKCPNQAGPLKNNGCLEEQENGGLCVGTLLLIALVLTGIFVKEMRREREQQRRL